MTSVQRLKPRIAIATCERFPAATEDDALLVRELRARYDVVAVPWGRDADVDAWIVRSTWDYHLRPHRFDRWLASIAETAVVINPVEMIRWNMHKRYLLELEAGGVRIVPTVIAHDAERARAAIEATGAPNVIVKPAISASAHKTYVLNAQSIDAVVLTSIVRSMGTEGALVQPFFPEVLTSAERSAVVIDGALSHVVRRLPLGRATPKPDGEHAAIEVSDEEARFVHDAIARVPEAPCYARVDYIVDDEGPRLMELELIEPSLFLAYRPQSAAQLARAIARRLLLRDR